MHDHRGRIQPAGRLSDHLHEREPRVRSGQNTCTGNGANWTQTGLGSLWGTPGADYVSADESAVALSAGDAPGWHRFDVTSTVQGWVSGSYANDGLLLKVDDESFSPCTTITNCNYWPYASNDYSDPSLRPVVTITYG